MSGKSNKSCWEAARRVLVGGVNSPVRSFKAVGQSPIFAERGKGPYLWDVEGKRYLDLVASWGALILGHNHPAVVRAAEQAIHQGITFGTPTPAETELAQMIVQAVPSVEQVRFVCSGTEAVMSALRLARAATGRSKVLKFQGGYHGHSDGLLSSSGSGLATLGLPDSPGVPASAARETLTVPFNDPAAVRQAVRRRGKELAAILVEPVQANFGVIPPEPGFLETLRELADRSGILLIFDEVITGFRVGYNGAQRRFGVRPDLTVLGKVIGGGFPIGAYGGPKRLMKWVAPAGPVYQAGTLAGHPVAMAAGLAALKVLQAEGVYETLENLGGRLEQGLLEQGAGAGVPVTVNRVGGLLSLFFTDKPVRSSAEVKRSRTAAYPAYFRKMLAEGVYLPPSPFEGWFLSAAVGEKEIAELIRAHGAALDAISARGGPASGGRRSR
ncbi:MAG: glutamate-1-semialdehyde-2,1-aminomutase [Candidatus Omnitrophica bacterium CG11_big_fil_rev_8_21_14_0_20_64_10]|nr:MAG: glutamate-1-semialdehyde-2,1-aminomutase [Candidatus Omnitrophica bacterium CG11_big_fil_rev_8_21_14_0_20_64_10]